MSEIKQIVRILGADIKGEKPVHYALTRIKGVSNSISNAICHVMKLDKRRQIGALSDKELEKIQEILEDPIKFKIPSYLLNRQRDYESGEDKHITSVNIKLIKGFDVKRLQKTKSYVGIRHAQGLPVRGQRTKAHFRKGAALGVKKKGKGGKKGK